MSNVDQIDLTSEFTQEVFEYLVELRDSGVTNMWGAASYIAEEFDMDSDLASEYLVAWIKTFR